MEGQGRLSFTAVDDKALMDFFIKQLAEGNSDCKRPKGNKLWKLAERMRVTNHSSQSMLNHFKRFIGRNLINSDLLSENDRIDLQQCLPNSRQNQSYKAQADQFSESDDDEFKGGFDVRCENFYLTKWSRYKNRARPYQPYSGTRSRPRLVQGTKNRANGDQENTVQEIYSASAEAATTTDKLKAVNARPQPADPIAPCSFSQKTSPKQLLVALLKSVSMQQPENAVAAGSGESFLNKWISGDYNRDMNRSPEPPRHIRGRNEANNKKSRRKMRSKEREGSKNNEKQQLPSSSCSKDDIFSIEIDTDDEEESDIEVDAAESCKLVALNTDKRQNRLLSPRPHVDDVVVDDGMDQQQPAACRGSQPFASRPVRALSLFDPPAATVIPIECDIESAAALVETTENSGFEVVSESILNKQLALEREQTL